MNPLQLVNLALPVWLFGVFLFHPAIAAGLGFASGHAASLVDPEREEYFSTIPERVFREESKGRAIANVAYLKQMLEKQMEELTPEEKAQAEQYLKSLGYKYVKL